MSATLPPKAAPAAAPVPLRHQPPRPGQVFLSITQICQRYGVHRATFYRWVHERGFPRPVAFSPSCARVPLAEIEAWEQAQLAGRG